MEWGSRHETRGGPRANCTRAKGACHGEYGHALLVGHLRHAREAPRLWDVRAMSLHRSRKPERTHTSDNAGPRHMCVSCANTLRAQRGWSVVGRYAARPSAAFALVRPYLVEDARERLLVHREGVLFLIDADDAHWARLARHHNDCSNTAHAQPFVLLVGQLSACSLGLHFISRAFKLHCLSARKNCVFLEKNIGQIFPPRMLVEASSKRFLSSMRARAHPGVSG